MKATANIATTGEKESSGPAKVEMVSTKPTCLITGAHEKETDRGNQRSGNKADTVHHVLLGSLHVFMSKDHNNKSGNQADEENRKTHNKADQKDQEREEGLEGSRLVFLRVDFFHNRDSVFFRNGNASLMHVENDAKGGT